MAVPAVFVEFIALTGQFKSAMKDVTREIQGVEKSGGGSWEKMSKAASTSLLVVGAAAAAAAVKSVEMATSFQSEMTLLVTATGQPISKLKMLEQGALNISKSTGVAASQIAAGMYIVSKSGKDAADTLTITKAAAQGAVAEGVDMTTMTNALTSIMFTYHLKASQAVATTNQMIVASGLSKTTMQEFAGSLSTVLPLAYAAHLSFAQMGGAIATLTQHGTSAERATQDLSNTIRQLQSPSAVAVKAMQQFGINAVDVQKNLGKEGLTGTLEGLVNTIAKHMGPSGLVFVKALNEQASAGQDLTAMYNQMTGPIKTLTGQFASGKIGLTDYRKAFRELGPTAAAQGQQYLSLTQNADGFNTMLKAGTPAARTMAGALKNVMGGAVALNTTLMLTGSNAAYFNAATDKIAAAANGAGKNIKTWAVTSHTMKNELDRLRAGVQATMIEIGLKLIPVVQKIIAWFTKHIKVVTEVVAGVLAFIVVTGSLAIAIKVITGVFNTYMKIVHGVQAAHRALSSAMETVRLKSMYAKDALKNLGTQVKADSKIVWDNAKAWASSTWEAVSGAAKSAAAWVASTAKTVAANVAQAASFVASKVAQLASTAATEAMIIAQGALNTVMDANPIVLVVGALVLLAGAVYEAYTHFKPFRDAINDVGDALKKAYQVVLEPVVNFFKNNWKIALEIALAAVLPIVGIPLLIISHWKIIVSFFEGIWKDILDILKDAGKWLYSVGSDILKGLLHGLEDYLHFVLDFYVKLPLWILEKVADAATWLLHIGEDILKGLWRGIENGAVAVWNWFRAVPTTILRLFDGAGTWLFDIGKDIINGLINGVKHMAGAAVNAVKDVGKGIISGAKDVLGIFSPSRVMSEEIGKYIPAGIADGILNNTSVVKAAMTHVANQITSSKIGAPGIGTGSLAGGGGGGPVVNLTMTIEGSVTTENDLLAKIEQGFTRMGMRRGTSYQNYKR